MEMTSLSSQLTPTEIKNKDFKKTMLGYSPEEVVGFLDSVAKLWEKVQKRERELLVKIDQLEQAIQSWKRREEELEQIKQAAQGEAEQILQAAHELGRKNLQAAEERSQDIRRGTEAWLAGILSEVEEVERRKNNFVTAFRSALDSHYEILKNEAHESLPLSIRLNEYLKQANENSGELRS